MVTKIVVVLWFVVGNDRSSNLVVWYRSGEEWSMRGGLEHDSWNTTSNAICRGHRTSWSSCCISRGSSTTSRPWHGVGIDWRLLLDCKGPADSGF